MHFIKTVGVKEADGKLKDVYAKIEEMFGMIPGIFQTQSLLPDVLEAAAMFIRKLLVERHSLSRFQKELIATYVSRINQCAY